jgi:hypothetical protein
MSAKSRAETKSSLSRVVFYVTIASGLVAAYLMYRRGESFGSIARSTLTNPVGSMISEVKDAV